MVEFVFLDIDLVTWFEEIASRLLMLCQDQQVILVIKIGRLSIKKINDKYLFLGGVFFPIFYVGALVLTDFRDNVFSNISDFFSAIIQVLLLSVLSYFIRYIRWSWLLSRAGHKVALLEGMLSYIAGFAFTVSPGKVGELYRIRYFIKLSVPPWLVISAFVYERLLDLVVVLLLCMVFVVDRSELTLVFGFVLSVFLMILILVRWPKFIDLPSVFFKSTGLFLEVSQIFKEGISGIKIWTNCIDISVGFSLGLLAWLTTAFSFFWLLEDVGIILPMSMALSIYALSLLIGAASFLPGGIGTTEAAIVLLLTMNGVMFDIALIAAVTIRIGTLWFATLLGLTCVLLLDANSIGR